MAQSEKAVGEALPADVTRRRSFMEIVTDPTVDRIVGIVAVAPFIYPIILRLRGDLFNFPNVAGFVVGLVFISTMFTRRPPVRVTPNPWYWLLAFSATYGLFLPPLFLKPGPALLPVIVTDVIAALGVVVTLYARLSLGRNIGFVPAQRRIVIHGAYRFVRHPIYTGVFLGMTGTMTRNFSQPAAEIAMAIMTLFIIKSFVEENFLQKDPAYAAYMQTVRYRWIPGIA